MMSKAKLYIILLISLLGLGLLLLGIFFGIKLYFKDEISYYEQKCQEYANENASLTTGGIVFVGDSLVEWYPLEEHYSGKNVYNRGIRSDLTLGVYNRLQTSVLELEPTIVVIMVGTNDITAQRSINAILKTYKEIVYDSFYYAVDIYVMSVPPQNKDFETNIFINVDNNNKRIRELNAKLEAFCDTCSATYINLYDLLVDENGYLNEAYSTDGLHLNNEGYTIWTNLLKEKLH